MGKNDSIKHVVLFALVNTVTTIYTRNATANPTCGLPPEQYFKNWQVDLNPRHRVPFVCNSSDPFKWHPVEFAFDNNFDTYWQSSAGKDEAVIIIDITSNTNEFLYVHNISLTFGDSQRPGQMKLLRSNDGGKTFSIWQYIVSFPFQCTSVFGVTYQETPYNVGDVLCIKYPSLIPSKSNETVSINLSGGRGGGNLGLQNWLMATHVKIEFRGLHRLFDKLSLRWHHYNVREIHLQTSCFCNGHASKCVDLYNNGSHVCVCENNACGERCNQCCPAYKQRRWKPGSLNPFEVDRKAACEACNCYNHSNVCIFNQTVANMNQSLDIFGNYSGGGVCQNCQHHTTGINCQSCKTFYYNPNSIDIHRDVSCKWCNCNVNGSRMEPEYEFLDCIKEQFNQALNMTGGDCFCKTYVNGSKCDQCQTGFYNLTFENPNGCNDCQCNNDGTKQFDISCSQESGQCNCKDNVVGLQCEECQDGFYNLTSQNYLGCNNCICNLGGSKSYICNKKLGNCTCHTDTIIGEKCDDLVDRYYYPSLHFLQDSLLKRSNQIIMAWRGRLSLAGRQTRNYFKFVFQCSSQVSVDAIISYKGLSHYLSDQIKVDSPCRDCYVATKNEVMVDSNQISVDIMFPSIASVNTISCYKLIAIPRQFYNSTALRNKDEFYDNCDVMINSVTNTTCRNALFTLTMDYLQGPLPCNCNNTGSVNNSCTKYMGQCPCKQGVTERICNQCKPGFYNFTGNGCVACNCFGVDNICDVVTGQCNCIKNTEGRACDNCTEFHWNITKTNGCQICNCSSTGANNGRCNSTTGQCECRFGVEGRECHTCSPEFKNFSPEGCQQCNCSIEGSMTNECDSISGQCLCKNNTFGLSCDQCKNGTFSINKYNNNGCLSCYCMGITNDCTMTAGRRIRVRSNLTTWTIQNRIGSIVLNEESRTTKTGVTIPMLSASIFTQQRPLFWRMTDDFFRHYGVSVYGGTIEWHSEISIDVARVTREVLSYVLMKSNDGIVYHHNINSTSFNIIEKHSVVLTEIHWRDEQNNTVTRPNLLKMLASPVNVDISASPLDFAMFGYHSRIGGILFTPLEPLDSNSKFLERNAVENCSCPTGYTGLSCEKCQIGFHRNTKNPLTGSYGACIPCNCHSHASDCNKETGVCVNCQHNTHGESCEFCLPGYYGNSTDGGTNSCRQCPCNAPYTKTNLCMKSVGTDGNVTCLNCSNGYTGTLCDRCAAGFYRDTNGAYCIPCQCNNNSRQCNESTGYCIDCAFYTTGNSCEMCKDGWYGNANNHSCKACACDVTGSNGRTCNDKGECDCKENVIGIKCTLCAERTYGFNNVSGCTSCNCSTIGSTSLQCNEIGVCSCTNVSVGVKCDRCMHGHWGLPSQNCAECNCNTTGSINVSCSALSGQCLCKPGITGRTCDACMKQHLNFSSTGCDECPACTQLLQKKTDRLTTVINQMQQRTTALQQLKTTGDSLNELSRNLSNTRNFQENFNERLGVLENGVDMMKSTMNTSISRLQNKIVGIQANLTEYITMATNETNRLQNIQTKNENAFQKVIDANISISNLHQVLDSFLTESSTYFEFVTSNAGSSKNRFNISDDILKVLNSTIVKVSQEISQSINDCDRLETRLESVSSNATSQNTDATSLTDSHRNIASIHNVLRNDTVAPQALYRQLSADANWVEASLKNIKDTIRNTEDILYEGMMTLNNVTGITNQTKQTLKNTSDNISVIQITAINDQFVVIKEAYDSMIDFPHILYNNVVGIANNFNNYSQHITSEFSLAEKHGTKVLVLLERINDMQAAINSTLAMQNTTNYTTARIYNMLSEERLKNLSQLIEEIKSSNTEVNMKIKEHQDSYISLAVNVSRINTTANNASSVMDTVYNLYPHLLNLTESNRLAYTEWQANLTSTEDHISWTNRYLNEQNRTAITFDNITDMTTRLKELNTSFVNTTQMVETARNFSMEAWSKVNDSKTIIENIDAAMKIRNQFNATKESLDTRLALLRQKLAQLKLTAAKVKAPVKFNGGDPISQVKNMTLTKMFFEVQMEFKTTQLSGLLLKIKQHGQVGYVKAWIENSLVAVEYQTDKGKFSIKNWEIQVSDGTWKNIHFSRMNNSSRLTVASINDDYSQTYGKYPTATTFVATTSRSIQLIDIQFGGKVDNLQAANFIGCMNFVKLNGEDIALLRDMTRNRSVCNARVPSTTLISGGASFDGNGFIVQKTENFSMKGDFQFEIVYRTFNGNGTLFQVVDQNKKTLISLTLLDGHLTYSVSFNKTSTLLRSRQSSYANGHPFKIHAGVMKGNLSINIYDNGSRVIEALSYSINTRDERLEGERVYLGGNNNSVSSFFVGCIFHVSLSDGEGNLQPRAFNGAEMFSSTGVLFNGCLKDVEPGVRFNKGSFSNISSIVQQITTVSMTFKTTHFSGTILSFLTKDTLFYLALYHGNIYMQFSNTSVYFADQMLNDNIYHTVVVEFSSTNISLFVNGNRTVNLQGWYDNSALFSNVVFGYNQQLNAVGVPVLNGFVGDVRVLEIDGISYLRQLVENGHMIIADGVSPPKTQIRPTHPATLPPTTTPPPTCARPGEPLERSNETAWIGFQGDSLLALQPKVGADMTFFAVNYVITLEFRSIARYGVLFFASNNKSVSEGMEYVAVELVDGRIAYHFDGGSGVVRIMTNNIYATGEWIKVFLIRISQFGAILVSNTDEYHNSRNGNKFEQLDIKLPLYIGGVPEHIDSSVLYNVVSRFHGCVRTLEIAGTTNVTKLNLRDDMLWSESKNLRQCYVNVKPQLSFRGDGYIMSAVNINTTSSTFKIEVRIRTTSHHGLLWQLIGESNSTTLSLLQTRGALELTYEDVAAGTTNKYFLWQHNNNTWQNTSFYLCDGNSRKITIDRKKNFFRLFIDDLFLTRSTTPIVEELSGSLYIAGSPFSATNDGFVGCIEDLRFHDNGVNLGLLGRTKNIVYGCV